MPHRRPVRNHPPPKRFPVRSVFAPAAGVGRGRGGGLNSGTPLHRPRPDATVRPGRGRGMPCTLRATGAEPTRRGTPARTGERCLNPGRPSRSCDGLARLSSAGTIVDAGRAHKPPNERRSSTTRPAMDRRNQCRGPGLQQRIARPLRRSRGGFRDCPGAVGQPRHSHRIVAANRCSVSALVAELRHCHVRPASPPQTSGGSRRARGPRPASRLVFALAASDLR